MPIIERQTIPKVPVDSLRANYLNSWGKVEAIGLELASSHNPLVNILLRANVGTAKAFAKMGSLQKKEMEVSLSHKMKYKEMHDLRKHCCSAYKLPEEENASFVKKGSNRLILTQENCKQSNGTLEEIGASSKGSVEVSQALNCEQLMKMSSSDSEMHEKAPLHLSEDNICASGASLIDFSIPYVLGQPNGCHSNKNEEERFLLESVRAQEITFSNLTLNDPISLAKFSGNGSLLDLLNYFPQKGPVICSRKKLLILDINGILADIVYPPPKGYKADTKIAGRAVFSRPFCSDFLNFCLERFNVAIWSSRSRKIIDRLLNYLIGDLKHKLIFCWDLSHCTESNFRTLENKHKALVFKELRKVWDKNDPSLPWEKGRFDESNTLLLDDTPYKALLNPPNTAVFPYSYNFKDQADDAIGPKGNIRAYLEEVAVADNVQKFIEQHPFGQSAITERSLSWRFYNKVIKGHNVVPVRG